MTRLIRFELKEKGIFQHNVWGGYGLSPNEEELLFNLREELYCPRLDRDIPMRFFFTRKGFNQSKKMLRLMMKEFRGNGHIKIIRRWMPDEYDIMYKDDEQVALAAHSLNTI